MSSKINAQLRNAHGHVQETVGSTLGNHSMQAHGHENQARADAELNKSKASGYVEGTGERVQGKMQSVAGAITGDRSQQTKGDYHQTKGDARQDFNRHF
ncbi:hypothetical protein DL96DRAFT_1587974 [Flagelloscypha sp. PMI_526]|nr:hypothetical protein DL96DRAFT_1587974 [Flagelloscypha sp. PMI_526]